MIVAGTVEIPTAVSRRKLRRRVAAVDAEHFQARRAELQQRLGGAHIEQPPLAQHLRVRRVRRALRAGCTEKVRANLREVRAAVEHRAPVREALGPGEAPHRVLALLDEDGLGRHVVYADGPARARRLIARRAVPVQPLRQQKRTGRESVWRTK